MLEIDDLTTTLYEAATHLQACRISLLGEPFPRVICPYGIARSSRNQIVLVCWQTLGITKAGAGEGYRNLKLERVVEIEILDSTFEKRADFNPTDVQYTDWVFHI